MLFVLYDGFLSTRMHEYFKHLGIVPDFIFESTDSGLQEVSVNKYTEINSQYASTVTKYASDIREVWNETYERDFKGKIKVLVVERQFGALRITHFDSIVDSFLNSISQAINAEVEFDVFVLKKSTRLTPVKYKQVYQYHLDLFSSPKFKEVLPLLKHDGKNLLFRRPNKMFNPAVASDVRVYNQELQAKTFGKYPELMVKG